MDSLAMLSLCSALEHITVEHSFMWNLVPMGRALLRLCGQTTLGVFCTYGGVNRTSFSPSNFCLVYSGGATKINAVVISTLDRVIGLH